MPAIVCKIIVEIWAILLFWRFSLHISDRWSRGWSLLIQRRPIQGRCQFALSSSHKTAMKSILLFRDFVYVFNLTCAAPDVLKALLDVCLIPTLFNIVTKNLLFFCILEVAFHENGIFRFLPVNNKCSQGVATEISSTFKFLLPLHWPLHCSNSSLMPSNKWFFLVVLKWSVGML